ncbi:DUF72 domain-containing protein [Lacticaseibacillus jixiensis]|uniref:DUF72 domain-containing protein n=1 Tax=Lacticaseibacillus jixiensis TaxID=3231926 RepID=UPI0036F341E2
MIEVGLTAIADHPSLAANGKTSTLADLAQYFPIVEIDSSFYGCPSVHTVQQWQQQVPRQMRFIVKATQLMTRHKETEDLLGQFGALHEALTPLAESNQLAAVLFQFPPYFGVTAENVRYLRFVRAQYPNWPIAVEFRHDGWYLPQYRKQTLDLLTSLAMSHVVVSEPQTPAGSVPLVPVATNSELTIMRLHGLNAAGWQSRGPGSFSARTNYRYTKEELRKLATVAQGLNSQHVAVIFNNNGGHDAADNALAFIALLNLHWPHLAPRQLDLF